MKPGYECNEDFILNKDNNRQNEHQPKHLANNESVLGDEETNGNNDSESGSDNRIDLSVFDQAEEPESEKERKSKRRSRISLGASAAILATAIIVTATANHGGNNNNNAAVAPVPSSSTGEAMSSSITSSDALSSMIESSELSSSLSSEDDNNASSAIESKPEAKETIINGINYSHDPTNVVEGYAFESLPADQKAEIKRMEAMSVEEFQALPMAEQLKFSYWVFTNYKPRFDTVMALNGVKRVYTENPTTPKDFAENDAYMYTFGTSLTTLIETKDHMSVQFDKDTEKKCVSLVYNAADLNNLKGWNDTIDGSKSASSIVQMDPVVEGYMFLDNDKDRIIMNIEYPGNDTYKFTPDGKFQLTFEKTSFKTLGGKEATVSPIFYATKQDSPNAQPNLGMGKLLR
jgi:hypothetical protein